MSEKELTEADFEDAAKQALDGNKAAAVGAVVGLLAGAATGHPIFGAAVGKGVERFASALVDRATQRLRKAERQYDDERERTAALAAELCAAVKPLFVKRFDELEAQGTEQFLQTIIYMERNVATAARQAELLVAVQELRSKLGPHFQSGRRHERSVTDILRSGTARRPPGIKNPATLLTARYEVVPFVESVRRHELTEIETWCAAPEPVGVRLFLGAGGTGKTRLFIEAARRLRRETWDAGFLPESLSAEDERDVLEGPSSALVVVDYAETRRELPRLLAVVADIRPVVPRKIRVALVAREQADWWRLMLALSAPVADLLSAHEPLTLRREEISLAERNEVFERSVQAFSTELKKPVPSIVSDLSDPTFGRPLYLAMAALGAVESWNIPPDKLLSGTLEHEKRYLKLHYFDDRNPDLREQLDFLHRALRLLAAATLRGGLTTREETDTLSRRVGGPDDTRTGHALRVLHGLYSAPASDEAGRSSTGLYLAGLEPDLLGEELVAQVLGHEETPRDYLPLVFDGAPDPAVRHGFMVLGRLGTRGTERRYQHWIASVLDVDVPSRAVSALDAALTLTQVTAHTPLGAVLHQALEREGNARLAREILPRVPWPTVALREVAAWATEKSLSATSNDGVEERAMLLNNLGILLRDLGRHEDALAVTDQAVRHYRTLAASRVDAFLPSLATSLNNLGNHLGDLGRRDDALAAAEEAVHHLRTLAAARSDASLPDLAMSLNTLGNLLRELGRHEDALAAAGEAVRHYRTLAASRLDAFLPDLALSLNNLSLALSELGRREDALAAAHEAVRHYRTLAASRPDAFLPNLAMSLSNLGTMLRNLGRREDALAATDEAVRHYRTLAASRPDAFLPDLAMSLLNFGAALRDLGRREDALAATDEAVRHYRTLAASRPDAFLPNLATSLIDLSTTLRDLGRREDAHAVAEEAVRHYRTLAASRPEAALPSLAMSLSNLGLTLSELGRREEALAATEEAVRYYRTLAAASPDAFLPNLAMTLSNIGNRLHDLGRREDALAVAEEALSYFRTLASARPDAFLPNLATSLNNVGAIFRSLGRWKDSFALTEEAVRHRRTLAVGRPAFLPDLAQSLHNLGAILYDLGRHEDAIAATEEAVRLTSPLASDRPTVFGRQLTERATNLELLLRALGRSPESSPVLVAAKALIDKLGQ